MEIITKKINLQRSIMYFTLHENRYVSTAIKNIFQTNLNVSSEIVIIIQDELKGF